MLPIKSVSTLNKNDKPSVVVPAKSVRQMTFRKHATTRKRRKDIAIRRMTPSSLNNGKRQETIPAVHSVTPDDSATAERTEMEAYRKEISLC